MATVISIELLVVAFSCSNTSRIYRNVGRSPGRDFQQRSINLYLLRKQKRVNSSAFVLPLSFNSTYNSSGHPAGRPRRPPVLTKLSTSKLVIAGYGCCPRVMISQQRTPKAQMSECVVKTPSTKLSGDIHRTGNSPSPSFR